MGTNDQFAQEHALGTEKLETAFRMMLRQRNVA